MINFMEDKTNTNVKKVKKNREVYLFNEISAEVVQDIVSEIRKLDIDKKLRPIHLFISSPGGDIAIGFALIDVILGCNCPVYTYALGEICSMAPAIFVSGKKRFISEHTFVMLHPSTVGNVDYVNFAKSRLLNAEASEKMYDDYFISRTRIPKNLYLQSKQKELWLTSQEAIKYGIATNVYNTGNHDSRRTTK